MIGVGSRSGGASYRWCSFVRRGENQPQDEEQSSIACPSSSLLPALSGMIVIATLIGGHSIATK